MKKWFIPPTYFIFGIILYILEDFGLSLLDEASISFRQFLNSFNTVLFVFLPVLIVFLMFRKKLLRFTTRVIDVVFILYLVSTFVIISLYWINTIQWK